MTAPAVIVGVDLGGTKVDLGVLPVGGGSVRRDRIPTEADAGATAVLERILSRVAALVGAAPVAHVGVATAGVVDADRIRLAANLPGLEALDVRARIAERFPDAAVHLLNDLNAAALGLADRAVDAGAVLVAGLGTGVATGLAVDGRVWLGAGGAAGEIGEALVPAPDGGLVALERLAGGRALDALAARHGLAGARALLDAAVAGRAPATEVLPRLDLLAGALAVAVRTVAPQRLALFGGLTRHPLVRARIDAALVPQVADGLEVRWLDDAVPTVLAGALRAAGAEAVAW